MNKVIKGEKHFSFPLFFIGLMIVCTLFGHILDARAAAPVASNVTPYGPEFSFYIKKVSEGYSLDDYGIRTKIPGTTKAMICNQWTSKNGLDRTDIPTNFIIVKSPGGLQLSHNSISVTSDRVTHTLNYQNQYIAYNYNTKLRANSGSSIVGYVVGGLWNPNWKY